MASSVIRAWWVPSPGPEQPEQEPQVSLCQPLVLGKVLPQESPAWVLQRVLGLVLLGSKLAQAWFPQALSWQGSPGAWRHQRV